MQWGWASLRRLAPARRARVALRRVRKGRGPPVVSPAARGADDGVFRSSRSLAFLLRLFLLPFSPLSFCSVGKAALEVLPYRIDGRRAPS